MRQARLRDSATKISAAGPRPATFQRSVPWSPTCLSRAHVFVKVTGQKTGVFKGDSTQKGKEDQTVVVGYHFELDAPRDASSGQATGKRVYKPLTITHEQDGASPQFLGAAATGENLTAVVINFWKTDRAGKETNFYRVTLTNAFLSSVKQDTSGQTVLEDDSFGFQKIEQENLVAKTTFSDNFLTSSIN